MKIKKEQIFWLSSVLIALAALTVLVVISFNSGLYTKGSLKKIYYADNISAAHQIIIDKFNERHKGEIEVLPVNLPFRKFHTNVKKEILARVLRSGSEQVDIFAVDLIWVSRFAKWGLPLKEHISDKELGEIEPFVLESCYSDSNLVAMPLYVDVGLLYYRRDIIESLPDSDIILKKLQEPITWKEFIQLGQRFSNSGKAFFLFPGDNFEGFLCSFQETLSAEVLKRIFYNDPINLNIPECRKSLSLFVDLINKYKLSPSFVVEADEYENYMYALHNDAVFIRGWPGFIKQYREDIARADKTNLFEMAPLPHFEKQHEIGVYGGWNLMVSKYSKQQKEAVKFLKFVQEEENQKILYKQSGFLPTNRRIYNNAKFLDENPALKQYWHILKRGKHRSYRSDYTRISDIITYYMNLALKKKISAAEALEQASEKINSKKVFVKK